MAHRLGKKPARPGAISFMLHNYADLDAVQVPLGFGHTGHGINWGVLGNDACGDCVWAGGSHEHMLDALATGRPIPNFTDQSVTADYSKFTGYNPSNPATDQGTDMAEAAQQRRAIGITDADGKVHKIKAYAAVRGVDHVVKSAYLFGSCGVGVLLPQSAMQQFDAGQPWTIVQGSPSVGGHYVPCVGRNPATRNLLFISWGRLQEAAPAWVEQYMDEAMVGFSEEYLDQSLKSPELFDEARLDRDLEGLGSSTV